MKDSGITIVGVIDAEDTVAPALLMHVDAAFRNPDIDIVQGGVQLMNLGHRLRHWFCLHNCLEYWKWFSNVMKFQAAQQFVPLGGNTVFVRYEMLERAHDWLNERGQQGPWPISLTEDCALGVLLCSLFGAKVATYYDPDLVTQEETPETIGGLFNQRVRWIQGFHNERRRRLYEQLPTLKQRWIALYILGNPVFQAFSSLMIPVTLYTAFRLKAPVGLVMLMYLPLIPLTLQMVLNGVYLRDFGKAFDRQIGLVHYADLILGHMFYQLILNAAAFWAMYREFRGNRNWYKTKHSGQHRNPQLVPRVATAASEGA
jgi:cellulose synthase/poly-beta-1,6-N-acetylglucosamine synthase-like glycosyltransferase